MWSRDQCKCVCLERVAFAHTQSQSPSAAELSSCFHRTIRIASGGKLIRKHARTGRQLLGGLAQNPEDARVSVAAAARDSF